MPYTVIDNVAYGSAELQIVEVFQKLPQLFVNSNVFMTYQDSGFTPTKALDYPEGYTYGAVSGQAYLLHPELIDEFIGLLDGFDEIFVVPKAGITEFPAVSSFCSLRYFSDSVPQDFIDSFKAVGASLYLGDGIGLNYACDPQYAPLIEELPDLETYHLRVLPLKLDRSGPFDPQVIGPIDIRKRTISL